MTKSLAKFLSYLLHPAIFPILGVFIVLKFAPYLQSSRVVLMTVALVFCGTYVIPVAVSLLLYRLKVVESLLMTKASDRRMPYAFSAFSFYFTAMLLQRIDILHEAYLFLLASAAVIVLHLFLLNFFKPSAHLAGIGGFLGLIMALSGKYQLNAMAAIIALVLLSGFLGSARLKLKAHTPAELVVGFISGWLIVFFILFSY